MASADFEKICVQDDLLLTTDKVRYAVFKGAQNITPSQYEAISKSPSSITFNVQLPSESTVFSRRIMVETTMTVQFTLTPLAGGGGAGQRFVNPGYSSALGPFPFHSCCNTIQATINNNTVSQNQKDIMFQLLRFGDRRDVARYNNATPTQYDSYMKYYQALGANNNPNGAWNDNSLDQDFQPRGQFIIDSIDNNNADGNPKLITLTFTTREPLMMSPFLWMDPESNNQGMYGVQTLNFTFNLGNANKAFRLAHGQFGTAGNLAPGDANTWFSVSDATITAVPSCRLLMLFLTRQPSNLVSARNVLPFVEYPRYLTNVSSPLSAAGVGSIVEQTFQSIQLNSVPDKLIIACRKIMGNQNGADADSFLPIRKINISFNNKAGLLSGATQWDLWRMSVESGSNQTWSEFSGRAYKGQQTAPAGDTALPEVVATCGSVLALEFGRHIELDDVYAPGSIGAFQLLFKLEVENNTGLAINENQYEIVLITMNSGVFAIERGTSQTYTAILSRADVLAVSSRPQYAKSGLARIVGGAVEDKVKMLARPLMDAVGMGQSGGGLSGGGASGGGQSGGGQSGGRMAKHLGM